MAEPLPALCLIAMPGRRRRTLELSQETERRGFAGDADDECRQKRDRNFYSFTARATYFDREHAWFRQCVSKSAGRNL